MKTYDSFNEWARDQSQRHRRLISQLRKLVSSVAPSLVEISKWGNGCWAKDDLPLLFLHAEEDHLQFGFFAGARLSDPKKLLRGKGKFVRHIRVETPRDVDEAAFSSMIKKVVKAPPYK